MPRADLADPNAELHARSYRRGAVLGLTVAEAFILLSFILLMLALLWRSQERDKLKDAADPVAVAAAVKTMEQLKTAGLDPQDPATQARVGSLVALGNDPAAQELLVAIEALPPPERRRLKELVETSGVPELAEMQAALRDAGGVDLARGIGGLGEAERRRLVEMIERKEVDEMMAAKDALEGAGPETITLAKEIAALPEDEAAKLEELVKSGSVAETLALKERILGEIGGEAERREALRRTIEARLGADVAEKGGRIEADGAIVLPDEVLFEVGSSDIKPGLLAFLSATCGPWVETLRDSGLDISEIRVEGHASSEWSRGAAPEVAYLNNLDLSQRRAQAVLRTCLALVGVELNGWAREHATAIGYSSSRPILVDGVEDPERSRRVVFGATVSREAMIEAIGSAASGTDAPMQTPADRHSSPIDPMSQPASDWEADKAAAPALSAPDLVGPSAGGTDQGVETP